MRKKFRNALESLFKKQVALEEWQITLEKRIQELEKWREELMPPKEKVLRLVKKEIDASTPDSEIARQVFGDCALLIEKMSDEELQKAWSETQQQGKPVFQWLEQCCVK